MPPIEVGARVIVYGIDFIEVRVKDVWWSNEQARWHIYLDWGQLGSSVVFDHDENVTWYKYATTN